MPQALSFGRDQHETVGGCLGRELPELALDAFEIGGPGCDCQPGGEQPGGEAHPAVRTPTSMELRRGEDVPRAGQIGPRTRQKRPRLDDPRQNGKVDHPLVTQRLARRARQRYGVTEIVARDLDERHSDPRPAGLAARAESLLDLERLLVTGVGTVRIALVAQNLGDTKCVVGRAIVGAESTIDLQSLLVQRQRTIELATLEAQLAEVGQDAGQTDLVAELLKHLPRLLLRRLKELGLA